MKLAVVVQRYGADLNGGAELHARYIAERLAKHADVEVLTTCARDYITWRNELPPGTDSVNGILVKRFKVSRERKPSDFGNISDHVFGSVHSIADELKWLRAEGPTSPELIDYLHQHPNQYDYVIFFSYRYYHTYHGIGAIPKKAILVPTAERDPALGLAIFKPTFFIITSDFVHVYVNYLFCFHKKFEDSKVINSLVYTRGLKYFLNGFVESQSEVRSFIQKCKNSEDKSGYLCNQFYELKVNSSYQFFSGPFTNAIFKIIELQKHKINVLIGDLKTTVNKKEFLFKPI